MGITRVICGHAITIDEFMQIYAIYQKYNGLEPLRMSAGEQAAWHEKMCIEKEKERKYWEMLTFEDYVCELKSLLRKVYTGIPADEVPRILQEDRVLMGYKSHQRPAVIAEEIFWNW